jgi:hypothetical protein
MPVAPALYQINELTRKCGTAPLWSTLLPRANEQSLKLQELSETLDLSCLDDMTDRIAPKKQLKTQSKTLLSRDAMLRVLVALAPILAEWKKNVLDPPKHEDDDGSGENYVFTGMDAPYAMEAELLASRAFYLAHIQTERLAFVLDNENKNEYDILQSAPTVRKLAEVMKPHVMLYLDLGTFPDIERFLYELDARILIVAYDDLQTSMDGFVGVLLRSAFARAMDLETREQWEPYLGLTRKVVKGTPEHLNPFIFIHRTVLSFSEKWGLEIQKRANAGADDRTMEVSEPALNSYRRLTDLKLILEAEADYHPSLLTAFGVTAPPPPPKKFPMRNPHNCTIYQPAIHQPRKRARRAKTTVLEDGATSKTEKLKVTPKLPTQTRTTNGISSPLEKIAAPESNTQGSASAKKRKAAAAPKASNPGPLTQAHTAPDSSSLSETIAAPESITHDSVGGKKRKATATPISSNPDPPTHNKKQDRKAVATTGSDSKTNDNASGMKRKATAAPNSSDPDPPTHNKKQGHKATATTISDGLTPPESQEDVLSTQPKDVTYPQEDETDVAIPIEGAVEVPQPNPAPGPPPPPILDKRFSTVNGRIVPSGRRTTLPARSDVFTEKEQFALYTKYVQVTVRQRWQSGHHRTAAMWFDMWQEVIMVLPGRGVINCIEFYAKNEEKFDF